MQASNTSISRRSFLLASAGLALGAMLPAWSGRRSQDITERGLTAALSRTALVGAPYPDTAVWCYNDQVPGPEIRLRQGARLRVTAENRLPEETTVHWHGIRLPNAMDGVPHLTQKPIARGGRFLYEFDVPDAGTYWYHPHQRGFEQLGRGLSGALIVEEPAPIQVDRDVVWLLDDWRLTRAAVISDDFGSFHDITHNGRIGNTVTINGRVPDTFSVRAGERLRLRLINGANARIFALNFVGHTVNVAALDGQPVEPYVPPAGRVVIAPAQRVDLVLDMHGDPGKRYTVSDDFYKRAAYRLVDLEYRPEPPVRAHALDASMRLPENPLSVPRLEAAERHTIELGGGMMNPKMMRGSMQGGMMANMHEWTINGVTMRGHSHPPLLTLKRGASYVFEMHNDTAWHHPMHLHGMTFQELSRNGRPLARRIWRDTVLLDPDERVEIAFVADNPGDWMFHCHILEHQEGGMMGTIRVA